MMKSIKFYLTCVLISLANFSYSISPLEKADQVIDQLEYAFEKRTIQHIDAYLTDDFKINDFSPSFSRQMLAGLIIELPIKKIKKRENISKEDGKITYNCKMVIAKYLGVFSQPIELVIVEKDGKQLIQHLTLKGQNGEGVGVQMEVGDGSESVEKEIVLDDLSKVEINSAPVYYEEGMAEYAKEINGKQHQGLEIARSVLGEEILFKIGYLVLKDTLSSLSIKEVVIPITTQVQSDEDQEIIDMMINWVYFHEATELHLLLGKGIMDPKTRWFRDGLADYVAHKVAAEINPAIDSVMLEERTEAYEEIKGDAQLLKWIGTGSDKKRFGIEGGSGQYAAAMFFFMDLTEKYGDEIIPQLMEALKEKKKIKSKTIIKELSRMTGTNIKKMLKTY